MATVAIKAVHDVDLINVLKKLDIYESVLREEYICSLCSRKITIENLGALYKENGKINLVCNDIKCLVKAAEITSRCSQAFRF